MSATGPLTALTEQQTVLEAAWSPGVLALLFLLAAAALVLGYLNIRRAPWRRRLFLLGLRTGAVGLVLFFLLEPAVQRREVTRVRNQVPILVDASRSMGLPDRPDGPTRHAQVAAWLAGQTDALARLATDHQLHFFTFGAGAHPADAAQLREGFAAAEPATQIIESLEQAIGRLQSEDLGGLVVISDGLDNGQLGRRLLPERPPDGELKDRLQALGAPVHTLLVGELSSLVDLAIRKVIHDEFAFVHNAIEIDVDILASGVGQGRVQAVLTEEGALLQSRPFELEPGRSRYRVTFSFTPAKVGKHHYRITLPELRGETIRSNNRHDFLIHVLRDRIRVLQVAGRPSWDQRFLRDFLKKSTNIDLISFFILRTATSLHLVPNSELSLIPFPAQELFEKELGSFDVIIFQNFDYRPYQMRRFLPFIRDYVHRGGGMATVGGDLSFSAGGYAQTPLEEALPVRLPAGGSEEELFRFGRFPLRLTEAGRRHPMLALSPDRAVNLELWGQLPELEGVNRILEPAPQAVVLATTPASPDAPATPVMVAGSVGRGRSLAILTDTTWRWTLPHAGRGGDLRHYNRFWNNAIRWLIQDPEQQQFSVKTDRDRYASEEEVRVEVRVLDQAYRPVAGHEVRLLRQASDPEPPLPGAAPTPPLAETSQQLTTDGEGRAVWSFPAGPAGVWRVRAETDLGGQRQTDETLYLSGITSKELQDVLPREDLLTALAAATQGTFRKLGPPLTDLPLRPSRVLSVHKQESRPLWNHAGLLLAALACLSLEWWLRRRWGFL